VTLIRLPYGSRHLEVALDAEIVDAEEHVAGPPKYEARTLIPQALRNPLGTKRLRELVEARRDASIVIVIDDHTRAAPTELMLDALLGELGEARAADRITILVACGTHEPPSENDLKRMLGRYFGRFPIGVHNCDAPDLVYLSTTSRGTPVWVNPTYLNADVKIFTGDITLHYYAGFGGGRKSFLPGIAGRETIKRNHALLVDPQARTAHLHRNPVHLDMVEAAAFAAPDFVLNCVSAPDGTVTAAFAGALSPVFDAGVAVAKPLFCRPIRKTYELLVVSAGGFPKDRNLYQAAKAIENCYHAVTPGGTLILVAECRDGIGDPLFEAWMDRYSTFAEAEAAIQTDFVLGGHKAFYLRRVMRQLNLLIVSQLEPDRLAKWQLQAYSRFDEALAAAETAHATKMGVVTNGFDTLLEPAQLV
jgi:nickel-dependent lactate racemase